MSTHNFYGLNIRGAITAPMACRKLESATFLGLQWHNLCAKFRENWVSGLEVNARRHRMKLISLSWEECRPSSNGGEALMATRYGLHSSHDRRISFMRVSPFIHFQT
jgi:hypothetical protein